MIRPSSYTRSAGFTLLELVVAITLMGLVLVMLYSGLRLGMNSWDGGERRAEATQRLRLAQEFLRRQLTQSITVRQATNQVAHQVGGGQQSTVIFTGQSNEIEFVAPMLAQLGQGGLYRVRIGAADGRLWIRWRPYLPADPDAGEERQTVLLDGVSNVEWAYFGPEKDNDPQSPSRWHPTWTSTQQRPGLVRLNLHLHGAPWPDLVAALSEGPLS